MSQKVTLGIIGAGRIGKLHAENIRNNIPEAVIKTISEIRVDAAKDWAKGVGIENVVEDYKEILNDPEIDAVFICSSTDTHAQITMEAANAGKDIFCEKPIDLDIDRIKKVINTVEEAGVKLQVGFNRRFDHNFKKVRDLIKNGQLGDPHIIKITSRDPEAPPIDYVKVSGGIFLDMTIHDFDMARYLSGSEVEEVYVNGTVLVDEKIGEAGDVDTAIITLKFANGALGVIDNSRKAVYGYDQRVEVFGSKGQATAYNDKPTNVEVSTDQAVCTDKPKYFFLERYHDSFVKEVKDFINAILNDEDVPVSGFDGLKSVEIGLAAKESLETNKPVKL